MAQLMMAFEILWLVLRMRIAVLTSLLVLSCAAADPDFTGTWNLNPSKSTVRAMPQPAPLTLKVEQSGDKVNCTAVTAAGEQEKCSYSLDRTETRNGSATAVAKWEGDAAMVNTIVLRPGGAQYTHMDRWTLARDGNTLRIRRQTVSLHGESESILVYERQGAAPGEVQLSTRPSPPAPRVSEPAA
jgi:hypothetical protein